MGKWVLGHRQGHRQSPDRGSIYCHAKQAAPSYFGDKILSWRIQEEGEYKGRVVFRFEASSTSKG
jgi:hypothetical protein